METRCDGRLVGDTIRNRQQQRRKDKGEMQKKLPHHSVIGHRSGGDFNKGFEQIDRRDTDESGRQFHF